MVGAFPLRLTPMRDGVDSKTGYKRVLVVTGSDNLDLSRQSLSYFFLSMDAASTLLISISNRLVFSGFLMNSEPEMTHQY